MAQDRLGGRVTMVAEDRGDTRSFIGRLHEAYARAGRRSHDDRRWLLEPPAWWVPTYTVAQRRALVGLQRDRLLAYRRPAA